jgi:hypothetical protein
MPNSAPGARAGRRLRCWGGARPLSSVPRHTVGHHANAANDEQGPTAACEGRRGEVPRIPGQPPHRAAAFPSSRIPTDRGAVGPTRRRALG